MNGVPAQKKTQVAILEDHPGTVAGYVSGLSQSPNVEVVATARFGDQLEEMLASHEVDVLILDVGVPASKDGHTPYPLFNVLPRIKKDYPALAILVISMNKQRTLVRAVMDAGAKGYILKDDEQAFLKLGEIVTSVAAGGVYFSQQSYEALTNKTNLDDDVEMLTERQREALSLCAAYPGYTKDKIARKLGIANSTLRNLLSESYRRLNVSNLAGAIIKARQLGLITPLDPEVKN
jgi:DNA-binding NarL/FixJ family response regulator